MSAYFKKFIDFAGGREAASRLLGISIYSVHAQAKGARAITPAQALQMERLSNGLFKKEKFIWPDAPPRPAGGGARSSSGKTPAAGAVTTHTSTVTPP